MNKSKKSNMTIGALANEVERLRKERDAWRDFAKHQERCAICGDDVDDCEVGCILRKKAESFMLNFVNKS